MKTLRVFIAGLATWAALAVQASVQVLYTAGGRTYEVESYDDNKLFGIVDGTRAALPEGGSFSLAGEWRSDDAHILFAPVETVERKSFPDRITDRPTPYEVLVGVRHGGYNYPSESELYKESLLLRQWPAQQFAGNSLVLLGWINDDRVIFLKGKTLPSVEKQWFLFPQEWPATEEEASGRGIALIVGRSGVLQLEPPFADAPAEGAYRFLIAGDENGFSQAIKARPALASSRAYNKATLLHFAAVLNRPWAVDVLVAAKAGRAAEDEEHNTPLSLAAGLGRTAVVERLLAAKTNTATGCPLHEAIRQGHEEAARRIVAAGADLNLEDVRNASPLGLAIDHNRYGLVKLLFAHGAHYQFDGEQMQRVLLGKCRQGQTELVGWLLGKGVSPNGEFSGFTPLIAAAASGNAELCRLLLDANARVNKAGHQETTPTLAAAFAGSLPTLTALVAAGGRLDVRTQTGETAVFLAACSNQPDALAFVLDHGGKPDEPNKAGVTPLEAAISMNAPETARLLVKRGATFDLNSSRFEQVLTMILRLDLAEALEAMQRSGWTAPRTIHGQWPLLQVADYFGAARCGELLRQAPRVLPEPALLKIERAREWEIPAKLVKHLRLRDPRPPEEEAPPTAVEVEFLVDHDGRALFPRTLGAPDPRLVTSALEATSRLKVGNDAAGGDSYLRIKTRVPFGNEAGSVYESTAIDQPPQVIKTVSPVYPEALRRGGGSGTVRLEFVVDTDGRVQDIAVISSAHPAFSEAAIEALRQWVFSPARIAGRPVNTRISMDMPFIIQP